MIKNNINKIRTLFLKNSDISRQVGRATTYTGIAAMAIYALCFICPPVHDNDSHAITGTSVASDTTLSISLSNSELPLDITPTSSNGTFVSTADDDTKASTAVIHVATNNITGYTLGIKASNPASSSADKLISNNEKCENTPTSNKCAISSLSQPVSSEDYIDNTIEGIDLNNTWGYAPSKYNSAPNTTTTTTLDPNTNENITTTSPINYYPAPVNGDTIATTDAPNQENTTTNDGALLEDEYTIDYGIRIDYTPYTGTYSTNYNNQSYIITAVGNPVPYSVSYNANIPTGLIDDASVTNMPTAQTGNVQGGDTVAVILSTKVPTLGSINPSTGEYEYAGYVFAGWCTVQPTKDQTTGYQTCPVDQQQPDQARLFQPGDNFGIDQTTENTQILYAVWGAPAAVIFNSNGLVFNDAATATENIMTFIPTYADGKVTSNKVNVIETGIYRTPILSTTENYIFKGWSADQNATEATYMDEQDIMNNINLNADDAIALYAIWAYTTVITFDGNGADSGTMEPITIEAGQAQVLPANVFTKEGYGFIGWNTVATPTEQDPGTSYPNQGDYTAEAGSHSITLHAQWATTVITFNGNGSDGGEAMDSINIPAGDTVNLPANTYTREGYVFNGWNTAADGSGTSYVDQAEYAASATQSENVTLYAQWMQPTMQNVALWGSTLSRGDTMQVPDTRDGKSYWVAKLADNNIWMTQNLDLDIEAGRTYTSADTDLANSTIGTSWTPTVSTSTTSSWTSSNTAPSSYDPGNLYWNGNVTTSGGSLSNRTTTDPSATSGGTHYHVGNYYNWTAAVAMNDSSSYTTGRQDVNQSICPAGWRLPTYSGDKSYQNLVNTQGFTSGTSGNIQSSPTYFVYGGRWNGSSGSVGSNGGYWSSVVKNSSDSYRLGFNASGYLDSRSLGYRDSGFSLRCVAR